APPRPARAARRDAGRFALFPVGGERGGRRLPQAGALRAGGPPPLPHRQAPVRRPGPPARELHPPRDLRRQRRQRDQRRELGEGARGSAQPGGLRLPAADRSGQPRRGSCALTGSPSLGSRYPRIGARHVTGVAAVGMAPLVFQAVAGECVKAALAEGSGTGLAEGGPNREQAPLGKELSMNRASPLLKATALLLALGLTTAGAQAAELKIETRANRSFADVGESGSTFDVSADISVLVTKAGRPVSGLGASVPFDGSEISLPAGWTLESSFLAPFGPLGIGCVFSPTSFPNRRNG